MVFFPFRVVGGRRRDGAWTGWEQSGGDKTIDHPKKLQRRRYLYFVRVRRANGSHETWRAHRRNSAIGLARFRYKHVPTTYLLKLNIHFCMLLCTVNTAYESYECGYGEGRIFPRSTLTLECSVPSTRENTYKRSFSFITISFFRLPLLIFFTRQIPTCQIGIRNYSDLTQKFIFSQWNYTKRFIQSKLESDFGPYSIQIYYSFQKKILCLTLNI